MDASPAEIAIANRAGIEEARRAARAMATGLGFAPTEVEMIVLATIELATNLYRHAGRGTVRLTPRDESSRIGIEVLSHDIGPGIPDIDAALRDGFSTVGGHGGGLPAVCRLMDEFMIASAPGGTRIRARKWRPTP